jgi:hypothetical protein
MQLCLYRWCHKLFTSVNDTGGMLSPVSLTPAMKHLQQNQLAYASK